jgi:hypothetical protein
MKIHNHSLFGWCMQEKKKRERLCIVRDEWRPNQKLENLWTEVMCGHYTVTKDIIVVLKHPSDWKAPISIYSKWCLKPIWQSCITWWQSEQAKYNGRAEAKCIHCRASGPTQTIWKELSFSAFRAWEHYSPHTETSTESCWSLRIPSHVTTLKNILVVCSPLRTNSAWQLGCWWAAPATTANTWIWHEWWALYSAMLVGSHSAPN